MARKPTRFWHPARRLLIDVREKARSVLAPRDSTTSLDDVRPRLQHYLRAMYGETMTVETLPLPKKAPWVVRAFRAVALVRQRGVSESDAAYMRLPASLPGRHSDISPVEQYRVLAVQHAERMRRGSARHGKDVTTDLERDLYQLAESAAIDARIIAHQPGLRTALDAARAESIAHRPKPRWRTDIELRVEAMVRHTWRRPVDGDAPADLPAVPLENDAESNATWARRTAVALEGQYGRKAARAYRRVPEVTLWQTTIATRLPDEQEQALETETRETERASPPDSRNTPSRSALPGPSPSRSSQNAQGNATGKSQSDKASSRTSSKGDHDAADGDGTSERPPEPEAKSSPKSGEDRSDVDGAALQPADGGDGADGRAGVGHSNNAVDDAMLTGGVTFRYPEWDCNAQALRPTGAIVRVVPPALGPSEWARCTQQEHAREAHRARQQFERLRSHRLRLRRQLQGDELDLEACVEAMVDRRMRAAPTDRLYSLVRPGRRELAITLLIDVSGSTSDAVAGEQRVIDIERIAAVVAMAAFDALGDDYSILAFSSASASNVRVHTLKEFGEKSSSTVLQRIGALAPHGTTRLGAAVRHATAKLGMHPAPHRLLLILSDGKPYDYDWYFVDYAVQDSRHAVMSARLQGIHPFCITIDASEGETYLPEIFGSSGYRVVSKPSQLSDALLLAVQRMIAGAA